MLPVGKTVHSRMKWLIAIQMIVGIAPLASFSLPSSTWMLPVMWALSALSLAQLMLLSVWVGMGSNKWTARLVGAVGGTAYVTIWPVLAEYVSPNVMEHETSFVNAFLVMFTSYTALVLLFSGSFLLLQRRGTKLVQTCKLVAQVERPRTHYSVFHLLVLMSFCSLVFSLVKLAQPAEQTPTGLSTLALVAGFILMMVVFLVNSICAAWATLSPMSPWPRIVLALVVSSLLGVAFAIASGNYSFSWWIFIAACLVPVVFTTIVIVSLLVVRSCGYRFASRELLTTAK